jgi:alpha-glucosidase
MEIMSDGINADRHAEDYRYEVKKVNNNTKMKIHLAAGGGFAAILTKE